MNLEVFGGIWKIHALGWILIEACIRLSFVYIIFIFRKIIKHFY